MGIKAAFQQFAVCSTTWSSGISHGAQQLRMCTCVCEKSKINYRFSSDISYNVLSRSFNVTLCWNGDQFTVGLQIVLVKSVENVAWCQKKERFHWKGRPTVFSFSLKIDCLWLRHTLGLLLDVELIAFFRVSPSSTASIHCWAINDIYIECVSFIYHASARKHTFTSTCMHFTFEVTEWITYKQ